MCPTWRHTLVFEASGGPAAVFLDRAWILGFTATFEYSITNGQAVLRGAGIDGRGGERVFSAAGKMHDDLKKSSKDELLKHSLFAAHNTD